MIVPAELPSVGMPRAEVLNGIYGILEPLEVTPPDQVFEGYAPDPPDYERDPLVQLSYPPDYVPEDMYKVDADGNQLPGRYRLQEVIREAGGRHSRSGGWDIRFPSVASDDAEALTHGAGLPVFAQVQSLDPAERKGEVVITAPTRPLGFFFLPDRQAAPEGSPDALFFSGHLNPHFRRHVIQNARASSELAYYRAPDLELIQLYGGLVAYFRNFRDNRELWQRERSDR